MTELTGCNKQVTASSSEKQWPQQKQLVLSSKPGCSLCNGLKEKLSAALSLGGPYSFSSVQLQVRDIKTNPDWERLYQCEIPVLAKLLPDGTETAGQKVEVHQDLAQRGLQHLSRKEVRTAIGPVEIEDWRVISQAKRKIKIRELEILLRSLLARNHHARLCDLHSSSFHSHSHSHSNVLI